MSHEKNIQAIMDTLSEVGEVTLISRGAPCRCGPGFCASEAGVGFFGGCGGSRKEAAPDCPLCGAPHQSTAGCWACSTRTGNDPERAQLTVRALRLGVSYDALFERQRITGETLEEQLTEMERNRQ